MDLNAAYQFYLDECQQEREILESIPVGQRDARWHDRWRIMKGKLKATKKAMRIHKQMTSGPYRIKYQGHPAGPIRNG